MKSIKIFCVLKYGRIQSFNLVIPSQPLKTIKSPITSHCTHTCTYIYALKRHFPRHHPAAQHYYVTYRKSHRFYDARYARAYIVPIHSAVFTSPLCACVRGKQLHSLKTADERTMLRAAAATQTSSSALLICP